MNENGNPGRIASDLHRARAWSGASHDGGFFFDVAASLRGFTRIIHLWPLLSQLDFIPFKTVEVHTHFCRRMKQLPTWYKTSFKIAVTTDLSLSHCLILFL